jgi:nitronate monooxygenase/enoyl-[acyl-carrier protein] reductase II
VLGATSLSVVLPAVVDAVRPLPVIAAGNCQRPRSRRSLNPSGDQAVSMGTAFVAVTRQQRARLTKKRITLSCAEDIDMFECRFSATKGAWTG